jgi:hypothetical protein
MNWFYKYDPELDNDYLKKVTSIYDFVIDFCENENEDIRLEVADTPVTYKSFLHVHSTVSPNRTFSSVKRIFVITNDEYFGKDALLETVKDFNNKITLVEEKYPVKITMDRTSIDLKFIKDVTAPE